MDDPQVIGVRVTLLNGAVRNYPTGREITEDGYGDYRVLSEMGALIAKIRRLVVDTIELVYAEAPATP